MSSTFTFAEKCRFHYRAWRYRWKVESSEVAFVLDSVSPGQTCLDIGAHKGAFTYWMQKRVGRAGQIFAFEPQPELASYLKAAKASLKLDNVEVIHAAVTSQPGEVQLSRPADSPSPSATLEGKFDDQCSFTVPAVSLDDYLSTVDHRPIDFIKCDVEGHELDVFRGAQQMLTTDRPTLLFECEQQHHADSNITDVFDYLSSLGFAGEYFHRDQLKPLSQFDPDTNVHGQPDYAYNFVFRPAASGRLAA